MRNYQLFMVYLLLMCSQYTVAMHEEVALKSQKYNNDLSVMNNYIQQNSLANAIRADEENNNINKIDWHQKFQLLYRDFNASISGDIKEARRQRQFMHLYMGLSRMIRTQGLDTELEYPLLGLTAKALSIAGGGIKGISAAEWLKTLENNVSNIRGKTSFIKNMFHLVAGTSTGGILAAFATLPISGMNMAKAQTFYFDYAKKIFEENLFHMGGMFSSKYTSEGLLNISYDVVGKMRMSDCMTPTIITAYNGTTRSMNFFSSEVAKSDPKYNYYMVDTLCATSAAPTFFSPVLIYNSAKGTKQDFFNRFRIEESYNSWGGWGPRIPARLFRRDSILNRESYDTDLKYGVMLDGGVNVNNPTMQALVEVGKAWGPIVNETIIVNVGTGEYQEPLSYKDLKNAGALTHIKKGKLFEVMLDQDFVNQQADGLASAFPHIKHFKLNIKLKDGTMDRTDTEFMENLRSVTQAEINGGSKKLIEELSEILAKPTISLPLSLNHNSKQKAR